MKIETMHAPVRWLLLAVLVIAGCGEGGGVRVGAKPFVEQEILAHALEGLLQREGIATRPTYRCTDTYDCARALQDGSMDIMVEYTGTAFHLLGQTPGEGDPVAQLDALYEPLGITWHTPLGFDNGYVWLASRRLSTEPLTTLSQLATLSEPLKVAVPEEYLRRPRDGLAATAGRYGIKLDADPVVLDDPQERLAAVIAGRADAVVVYGTDPSAAELGLLELADDQEFLPRYAATVVVRSATLAANPGLSEALAELRDTIDAETMRGLNAAVANDGEPVAVVAQSFLRDAALVSEAPQATANRTRITIATDDDSIRQMYGPRVLVGIRSVFPGRAVTLLGGAKSAVDDVVNGRTRFAVVGVEAFFSTNRKRQLVRNDDLEALAVLGQRVLHLLAKTDADPWAGPIGLVQSSGSDSAAAALLRDRKIESVGFDTTEAALAGLGNSVDAVLVAAPINDPAVAAALRSGARLVAVSQDADDAVASLRFRLPYLRAARIAPGTYPNQPEAIESLAAQVVLAGPSSAASLGHHAAGPAGALPGGGAPTVEQREALSAALSTGEAPDPSVPSSFSLGARAKERSGGASVLNTLLNLFVIAFCGWLVVIVAAPAHRAER